MNSALAAEGCFLPRNPQPVEPRKPPFPPATALHPQLPPPFCHPEEPTCLRQVKGWMNMGKRCMQSRPRGPAPKISPARKGWVHRHAVERRRCGTTLCVCSLGAADSLKRVRRVGRERQSLCPLQKRRVKSKGAPGLAFETWDPSNQFLLETLIPAVSLGAKPICPKSVRKMPWFSNHPFFATTLSFLSSRGADLPAAS
jgi:hypothetical protein